jgi:hypothetical protein
MEKIYHTQKGKMIEIYHDGRLWKAKFTNGGVLPPEFESGYTSEGLVQSMVQTYDNQGKSPEAVAKK